MGSIHPYNRVIACIAVGCDATKGNKLKEWITRDDTREIIHEYGYLFGRKQHPHYHIDI